jgi:hypothetical protein
VCPNEETDNPDAKYEYKTQEKIQKLIDKGDLKS